MDRPRLKAHFTAQVVDGSKVFLLAEGQHYLIQGTGTAEVLPYLDGRHTVADIAVALSGKLPLMQVLTAIRKFDAFGHLADGRPDWPEHTLAYWDAQGLDPEKVRVSLADTEFTVTGAGADPGTVIAQLREHGLRVRQVDLAEAADPSGALTLVVVNDYLDPALERLNTAYLAAEHPWALVKPAGMTLWAGPVLQPGRTGCWSCLSQRISGNRQVERYLAGKLGTGGTPVHPSRESVPAGPAIAGGLLAVELARIAATGAPSRLEGKMTTIDLRTLAATEHTMVRLPQCAACGEESLITERSPKVVLTSRDARHVTDGGYRIEPPSQTYDRLQKHISPLIGAVTRLHTFAEYDNGVTYSFTAGHNFAMVGDNMDLLRRNLRGQSGGKGRTEVQAKVSALCEAIERYSGVWRGDEPVREAAYADLDPAVAVHPESLLHFSPGQYAGRDAWNKDPGHRLHLVPEKFRTDLPIDWSPAWSLTDERERLVPSGYAWYGHPDLERHFYCVGDSNGNASGNSIEEAILQGFCELVERDAVALWWYNRARRPAFDLDSLRDPYVDTLREFYRRMGRDIWLLDLTTDLGIPAFVGVSHRVGHPVEDVIVGFGAHLDPRIAAIRTLTEVNQFLPSVERRDDAGETIYLDDDVATLAWWKETKLANEPWLVPDPSLGTRSLADHPLSGGDDLAADVETCVAKARACDIEVVVLDQTRPDLELSVVRVIAPGMRHFWRRLGAGRLYDVPVALGWVPQARTEDQLNPTSVFF
ncbi:TOMM precursor leader peptide-binding protein [Sphaerisporangium corydalis]|uniref:TOMM leader peptide-binding protein n=1 Tax=Sphaerisporangium corydalis TaxID=1441875 RepID=A0ABV9ELW6_9ACTN|nr:TOMM precursor leader peptide-binding protein [Sphaerisporangium corydalis]